MKKIVALFLLVFMIFCLSACKQKQIDTSQFDDGPAMDAEDKENYAQENPGNPYAQSEIGLTRAQKNLSLVFGTWDSELKCYQNFKYIKNGEFKGNPCYYYSRVISNEEFGDYTHKDYVAVYKDGSKMTFTDKMQ